MITKGSTYYSRSLNHYDLDYYKVIKDKIATANKQKSVRPINVSFLQDKLSLLERLKMYFLFASPVNLAADGYVQILRRKLVLLGKTRSLKVHYFNSKSFMAEVKFMYNDEKDRKHLCGMLADKYLGIDAFDAESNELIVYDDYGKLLIVNSMFPGQIKINYVDCRNNFFIYTLNYLTAGYRKKYKGKFVGVYKPFDL